MNNYICKDLKGMKKFVLDIYLIQCQDGFEDIYVNNYRYSVPFQMFTYI
jgi:hypothetical protein